METINNIQMASFENFRTEKLKMLTKARSIHS